MTIDRSVPVRDPVIARLVDHVRELVPAVGRMCGTPGLGVALAAEDQVVLEIASGFADVASETPRTPDTVFRSGSMGKVYTATAVMQLVERGVLALDDPVNKHITAFRIQNPLGERDVTVEDLLTHRSGLAENAASCSFTPPLPLGEHLAREYANDRNDFYFGALRPRWSAKTGETFQYSNTGIATLGYLVEVANPEGLSFSEYILRNVLEPLGMMSTRYPAVFSDEGVPADIRERTGTGYTQMGGLHIASPPVYFADFPAGNVVTTPGDHARLMLAFARGGEPVLRQETVKSMLTARVPHSKDVDMGLVMMLRKIGTQDVFGHAGAHMWGWTNTGLVWPDHGVVLVTSSNHWSVIETPNSQRLSEGDLLAHFVSSFLAEPGFEREPRAWPWKVSYVAGMTVADRFKAQLGVADPLTDEMVDFMVAGAYVTEDDVWDADGFRAGVRDLLGVDPLSPAAIAAFLKSDALQVHPAEVRVINRALSGVLAPAVLGFEYPG